MARVGGEAFLAEPFKPGDLGRCLRAICETSCTPARRSERRCDLPILGLAGNSR